MANVLPSIRVTDEPGKESVSQGPSPIQSPTSDDVSKPRDGNIKQGSAPEGMLTARPCPNLLNEADGGAKARSTPAGKTSPNKLVRNPSSRAIAPPDELQSQDADGRRDRQTSIDPLSHHILKRTHTENMIPQKLRAGGGAENSKDSGSADDDAAGANRNPNDQSASWPDNNVVAPKEKKKGVKFLSRFIGGKKKESSELLKDDVSEQGDNRTEGMDAHVFAQPIGYGGYTPQHPPPPKYIKVRSHNKKEKDFNRVFLAQELQRKSGPIDRGNSDTGSTDTSASPRTGDATWALEFSKDGRYLAAGGQERIVRVWAVITTAEERKEHEREEDATLSDAGGQGERLNAPVFQSKPLHTYQGHTADVLDLSWSKNNFLLSSSMDKTVRLWHVSRKECLCCFKHSDFVTSIQFHPRDDRFFLAGSLDSKLRLWSIPDKSVAFWNQLPDLITAVAFTPDGKTAIAGCLGGLCLFYETEGLKYQTQLHVRSSHGRNAKGKKVTGIVAINHPPDDPDGEVKLLITSNDSRVRLYNFRDKSLETKFKGNENSCSQIRASFSDDAQYVISGSEDRKVYLWSTGAAESDRKEKRPVEMFESHSAIVTTAILAPMMTRQLLGNSGDPLYDLCNPPPITLVSRADSQNSSKLSSRFGNGDTAATPASAEATKTTKPERSPAYVARSSHPDGNIIVTADYMGRIKVFRQDCAYHKRQHDSWDASSTRIGSGFLGRSSSIATRNSNKSRRSPSNSISSNQQPSDRILSWRNSIASNGSLDKSLNMGQPNRSVSPRKSLGQMSFNSITTPRHGSTPLTASTTPSINTGSPHRSVHNTSIDKTHDVARSPEIKTNPTDDDPLMLQNNGQSLLFWNMQSWKSQENKDPSKLDTPVSRRESKVSALTSEESSMESEGEQLTCRKCGSTDFKARTWKGLGSGQKLVCTKYAPPHKFYNPMIH
ncbi:MAG: hypothetical protein M1812_004278 [Candelaria pacifica]|nr:MAG: hypothetical protein M1812_004278 [Candelaria pacifica]